MAAAKHAVHIISICTLCLSAAVLAGAGESQKAATETLVLTKAWTGVEGSGCRWLVTFDESSQNAAVVYDNLKRLLPEQPVDKWTLVWLEINNEKGKSPRRYSPSVNRLHMSWKDASGKTHSAASEDMSNVIVTTARRRAANPDEGLRKFLDYFREGEVPAGERRLKVVIFDTRALVTQEEAFEFHLDASPAEGRMALRELSIGPEEDAWETDDEEGAEHE